MRGYIVRPCINFGDFLYICQREKTNIQIGKTNVFSLKT